MYGGIFTVNGFTSVCSSKSTRSLIICTIYIIANKNNPKTEVSNNLSGVKNITHETRQLLKWPARNPLSLDLKEKKNEHFCFTCRTSFRLKYNCACWASLHTSSFKVPEVATFSGAILSIWLVASIFGFLIVSHFWSWLKEAS